MQAKCREIFRMIEEISPPGLAEDWDNSGLQAGDPEKSVTRILLSLDMDEQVLLEAVEKGAGLVVTHHPLIFKGIKQLREDRPQGRLLAKIIRSGITVYSAHTNLDSAGGGVSAVLAEKLGIPVTGVLRPGGEKYLKLAVFVPAADCDRVREAISRAGAGWIGNYSDCAFMVKGTGTFRPMEGTNPYIGSTGRLETVEEVRLETIMPAGLAGPVVKAMLAAHPYEEVAYDLYPLENRPVKTGLGRVGRLLDSVTLEEFARRVKSSLGVTAVRAGGPPAGTVRTVALCGGSGGDFWPLALNAGADVFVTGDIGYHTARDMLAAGISFVDAGHYGTERVVLDPLARRLGERFRARGLEVEVLVSSVNGDPFAYV